MVGRGWLGSEEADHNSEACAFAREARHIEKLREHLVRAEQSGFFEPDVAGILAGFKRVARKTGYL